MKIVKMNPNEILDQVRDKEDSDLFQGEEFIEEEIEWDYQGKSRRQVEGSYKAFALCMLAALIALLMWITN